MRFFLTLVLLGSAATAAAHGYYHRPIEPRLYRPQNHFVMEVVPVRVCYPIRHEPWRYYCHIEMRPVPRYVGTW